MELRARHGNGFIGDVPLGFCRRPHSLGSGPTFGGSVALDIISEQMETHAVRLDPSVVHAFACPFLVANATGGGICCATGKGEGPRLHGSPQVQADNMRCADVPSARKGKGLAMQHAT
jgi:hypothetical protein